MNETLATPSADLEPDIIPCRRLRTKMYYVLGREAVDLRTVRDLVDTALGYWPGQWVDASDPAAPHEAGRLALTIDKARATLGWAPRWSFETAVSKTVSWYRGLHEGQDVRSLTKEQIAAHAAKTRAA